MCDSGRLRLQVSVLCVYNRGCVCNWVKFLQEMQITKHQQISSLMTMTKTVLKTLVYSSFNYLTWPMAWKYFIKFSCHDSFKLYITMLLRIIRQTDTLLLNIIRQTYCSHILEEFVQHPSWGVCETHTCETSNLCLVHHQLVTCNHGLHVLHGLLDSAQVGNTWVSLFWSRPTTKYFSLQ